MKFLIQLVGMLLSMTYFGTVKLSRKIGREIKTKYQEMYYKNTCTVCLEKLTGDTFQIHCHHQFHPNCLLHWFVANMQNLPVEFVQEQVIKSPDEEVVYICPLCRGSLRSDYYNDMICKPNGYRYSEKFKGDPLRDPFPVTTLMNCAQECDTDPQCHAYTIGYEYSETERSIRGTVCRLFQPNIRHDQPTKKKSKEKQHTIKHSIRNVCRKQTDQELRLSQHLPTFDISPKSRLYKINEITKAYLELLKVFSLFFISALNHLWTYIKTYRPPKLTPGYFIKLLFQPIIPKYVRLTIIPWILTFLFGYEWDVQSEILLKRTYVTPSRSTRENLLRFEQSKPTWSILTFSFVHAFVATSIIRKLRINTYHTILQKLLAMYFTYLVITLSLYGELFSSNSALWLVLLYIVHLFDLVI